MSSPAAPVQIIDRIPTAEEHRALFEAVGWQPYTTAETEHALAHTLAGVVAVAGSTTIGMGRVIGDGGKFFYIQDFAVHPDHQRGGVGQQMLDRLLSWITAHAPGEPFIGLFATAVAIPFYRRAGFAPHTDALTGMWMVVTSPEEPEPAGTGAVDASPPNA